MISTDLIGASGRIEARFDGVPGYRDALLDNMARSIVGEALERGVRVEVDDIVAYHVRDHEHEQTVEYGAVWAPSPVTRGVELFGGSHDGEIMKNITPDNGPGNALPPRVLRVMSEPPTRFPGEPDDDEVPTAATLVEDYHRAGIDPAKRRFIYTIKY